jgi:hypothetical protein
MLIRLDDHALVDDLCVHYTRSGFVCERVGGGMIEVSWPVAPTGEHDDRACLMHLQVWKIANPGARAEAV